VMEQGLQDGFYRRGFHFPSSIRPGTQAWSHQGWEEVQAFLRAADTEPVVTHYSCGYSFPHHERGGWEPPEMPGGWRPGWAVDGEGLAEWQAMSEDERDGCREATAEEAWDELPDDDRWDFAFGALLGRPWLRLSPSTLSAPSPLTSLTVYDLLQPSGLPL